MAALVFFSSCTRLTDMTTRQMFPERLDRYKRAILWSDFESASTFKKSRISNTQSIDEDYSQIKVTAYDVKAIKIIGDLEIVQQRVEIRFYRISQLVEKSINDTQTWEWDPETKLWYLVSGLPEFE